MNSWLLLEVLSNVNFQLLIWKLYHVNLNLDLIQYAQEEAVVQHLYFGRNPPMFTDMRVLRESTDDDHLVCFVFH